MNRTLPLDGVRIADFSQLYQGPLATMILADLGADVVKIEGPRGDFMRSWSLGDGYLAGESLSFLAVNRNKRSACLDLKTPGGALAARRIVASADVVIENFRPGVMDRLGLGYDALAADRPDLVYCASSGWGQTGPYRDFPGQDLLVQALGGTMWLNGGRDDPPTAVGFGIADVAGGFHIVYGVLAALLERTASGLGQRVDVSLLNSLLVLQGHEFGHYLNTGQEPERPRSNGTAAYTGSPLGVYRTADGHLAIAMMSVSRLAGLVGAESLAHLDYSNVMEDRDRLHGVLEARFRTAGTERWLEVLRAADVWCAPVHTFAEVERDPQVAHNAMIRTMAHPHVGDIRMVGPALQFSATPATVRSPPPLLGEHTVELLGEVGFGDAEIREMLGSGAVAGPHRPLPPPGPAVPVG